MFLSKFSSVQSLSCVWLCKPKDWRTPGLPVHHQLPELAQAHVHRVSDAIQPFHPLLTPSPPAFKLSQHQGLFKWVSHSQQVARLWKFQVQHHPSNEYSGLISFRIDCLDLLAVQGTLKGLLQHPQFKSINSSALSFLHSSTLTSIHDYWKTIALTRGTFVSKVSAF